MPARWRAVERDVEAYLGAFDVGKARRYLGIRHLHLAIVYDRRGCRLAAACNRRGSRSCGAGFDTHSLHAERAALKAVGDVRLLRQATLVVLRLDAAGEARCSAPCHACAAHIQSAIRKYGLGRVVYSA
jgi:hypothetical protein